MTLGTPIRLAILSQEASTGGIRDLLKTVGNVEIVAECRWDGRSVASTAWDHADLALVDLGRHEADLLPALLDLIASIRTPVPPVLIGTTTDDLLVAQLVKAGVGAYVLKDTVTADLGHALEAVRNKRQFLSPPLRDSLALRHLSKLGLAGTE